MLPGWDMRTTLLYNAVLNKTCSLFYCSNQSKRTHQSSLSLSLCLSLWPNWTTQLCSLWSSACVSIWEEIISSWSEVHCWFNFFLSLHSPPSSSPSHALLPYCVSIYAITYAILRYPVCIYPRLHLISFHKERNILQRRAENQAAQPMGSAYRATAWKKHPLFRHVEILIWFEINKQMLLGFSFFPLVAFNETDYQHSNDFHPPDLKESAVLWCHNNESRDGQQDWTDRHCRLFISLFLWEKHAGCDLIH